MFTNILREIFFPRRCLGCGTRDTEAAVCESCLADIPINSTLFCGQCHARLPSQTKICHRDCPYLLGAAGEYNCLLLKTLIHALKFKRNREVAGVLGTLLARYVERAMLDLTKLAVVPLPLSRRRERERGFNQSKLIAREFVAHMKRFPPLSEGGVGVGSLLPIVTNLISRPRHASPQSETKGVAERERNVRGAFAVHPNALIHNNDAPIRNIILIDDVTTSGATFREAALVLKAAGARRIIALACAKA